MKVVIDTHSLIWFLFADEKLSDKAKEAILQAEIVLLPTLVLLEAFHVSRKLKFEKEFNGFLSKLPTPYFQVIPLGLEIVFTYVGLENELDIHDKIIVSSARFLGLPIITRDKKISKVYEKVVW